MTQTDDRTIAVLDHGLVRLVSYTQPAAMQFDEQGDAIPWTGDHEIVRNARVSYAAKPRGDGSDAQLLKYLAVNRHTSPFEAMVFTFEVKAPIFVLRQWHRHRTWSYNEVSARYTELPEEYYIPEPASITEQSKSNKQMRGEKLLPGVEIEAFRKALEETSAVGFRRYQHALSVGVPRELARLFLPLNTYSHMFATVDLHNLFHFLRLRLHAHAQPEIQVYAQALLKLITPVVPGAVAGFMESLT
jgi:thymidylate synthase (FAD)